MKLLPVILLNLATVAVSIAVYDHLRTGSNASATSDESVTLDRAALDERIAALEAEQRPALRGTATDLSVLERLNALEEAVRTKRLDDASDVTAKNTEPVSPTTLEPLPTGVTVEQAEPGAAEIHRFRRLQAAARRQERLEKNAARIDRSLEKLSLNLSARQRARIHEAYTAFQPRVGEIWGEIKTQAQETVAAGGTVDRKEVVQQGMAQIQQEFAQSLDGVVAPADAEIIASTLHPGRK